MAPCAQSKTIFKLFKLKVESTVSLQKLTYLSIASSIRFALPIWLGGVELISSSSKASISNSVSSESLRPSSEKS